MNLKYFLTVLMLLWSGGVFAQIGEPGITAPVALEEVVVSSTKETNELKTLPGSISFIGPQMMDERKITSIVDLSAMIPNFFIPNYGSKMSTPVYIRGIGERSTGQSIGLYVDNMPYLDKSVFNFDFMDVQRIELLRGPQGTLYGRNAMSGIINIYTWSPLEHERTKLTLSAGNYGHFRANASVSRKIGNKAGISLSGYYDANNGFFENQYDGKRADRLRSAGSRLRFDWRPAEKWTLQLFANYDYSEQGAFPYGVYSDGKIAEPDYDHPGKYIRQVAGGNVNLEYRNERIVFTSSTGFQYFDDDMKMDLDYTSRPVFTINQLQLERNWTQEFAVKSNTSGNYRWSFGAFGFSRDLRTDVITTMGKTGIETILQPFLDAATADKPHAPALAAIDNEIPIPGTFKTPAYGGAVFHQSTCNNLLIAGLSLTAGIRMDYEKTELDYNTYMLANINAVMNGVVVGSQTAGTTLIGAGNTSFTEWLPKASLKYEFDGKRYVYFSTSKGYKTGGYNIQMFADIVQGVVRERYMSGNPNNPVPSESLDSILALTSYQPEYSWNYELGFKGDVIKDVLRVEAAVFYVDVKGVQITQFVESGQGRLLKNAGRAESAGFDLGLTAYPVKNLSLSANYGYAHAVLKDYQTKEKNETGEIVDRDYSGNHIPFAPQNTFSTGAAYSLGLRNQRFIDRFNIQAHYNGAGRIYWTEANDVYQKFYGLLNLKAGVSKGVFKLDVWTKNTLNTDYAAFYFTTKTSGSELKLAQKGAPFQMGVDLTVAF
jgi:outer membrane receptor protein involved in Fe transport